MTIYTIKVTVLLQDRFWVGLFERNDAKGFAVARQIFGSEPTDAELYQFISHNYRLLKFSSPQNFELIVKRKNPKRIKREVRKIMAKAKSGLPTTSRAQDVLREELEKNKKLKKTISKVEKETQQQQKFQLRQAKKKKKHRGH